LTGLKLRFQVSYLLTTIADKLLSLVLHLLLKSDAFFALEFQGIQRLKGLKLKQPHLFALVHAGSAFLGPLQIRGSCGRRLPIS
jgi:hypothetical protein